MKRIIQTPVYQSEYSTNNEKINVYISLVLRTLLFLVVGLLFVLIFLVQGNDHPFKEAEKWWPFQAIIANFITFIIIRNFLRKEKLSYKSLFLGPVIKGWKKIREYLLLVILAIICGAIPLYIFSYLLLGSIIPPATHFQKLPILFAAIALTLFPLSNALVETPTYLGYALPRLQKITGKVYVAILLAGFGLALQHVFLPIVLSPDYMLWRLLSFIPLAILLGVVYTKTNRIIPIVVVHFILDLQLVSQMFINSL